MSNNPKQHEDASVQLLQEELKARDRLTSAAEQEIKRVWDAYSKVMGVLKILLLVGGSFVAILAFFGVKSWSDFKIQLQHSEGEALTNEVQRIRGEISLELERQFTATNIHELISEKAVEEIDRTAPPLVAGLMSQLKDEISSLGSISDAGAKMRIGLRSGADDLIAVRESTTNVNTKLRANLVFNSIAKDYEILIPKNLAIPLGVPRTAPEVAQFIMVEPDLNRIAAGFFSLREMTGIQFKMFDFNAVSNWLAENSAKSKDLKAK